MENEYEDGYIVTEKKLLRFLDERVVPTGNQRKDLQPDGNPYPLGTSAIDQYINAVVDIYATQQSKGQNSHPHPRGLALKSWKRAKAFHQRELRRRLKVDRGIGGINDGYTREEMVKVADYFFQNGAEHDLRERMAFLFHHMLLLRGEDTRALEFADIFTLNFDNEGPTECPALVLQFDGGKTNQNHLKQYAATIRHENVQTCAIGAMAIYFFHRFERNGEEFPSFEDNDWFEIKVCKGHDRMKEMSYDTQRRAITKAFKRCQIHSRHKTHAGRGSGARYAVSSGATEDQVRKHGRWQQDALQKHYLTGLPKQVIRTMNGFPPEGHGFFLKRACVTPSEELQQKIFPQVEDYLDRVQRGDGCQRTICGQGFLLLLQKLRLIFLQDVVMLRAIPGLQCSSLFSHKLFQDPEFLNFEPQLLHVSNTEPDPQQQSLHSIVPTISDQLTSIHAKMDGNQAAVMKELDKMSQENNNLEGSTYLYSSFLYSWYDVQLLIN